VTVTGRAFLLTALICLAASQGCAGPADGGASPVAGSDTGELRDEAVRVAEQAAVTLTSLDRLDGEAGYDRLLELLTDPARQEWEQRRAEYLATIMSDAATSDSAVTASGVAAFDPATAETATVLVAVTATVSTEQNATPDKLHHRLQLSLINTPAGWQISQLTFVE
jgi:hypothetical protein